MGKHNGKARTSGLRVGAALANRVKKGNTGLGVPGQVQFRHTTEAAPDVQSMLETNDLNELMTMATLAGRDFTAERQNVVVISTGAVNPLDKERSAEARRMAEEHNRHRLRIPRRPSWTTDMSAEQLDAQERSSFLEWRRELARLEEDEGLVLTPFEKNLEVWRQLWRVLERSDVVVQVLDARDPLRYRSEDLEAYAREIHPTKSSILLLNKADLLPAALRSAWADYFDKAGVRYVFWSAKAAAEAAEAEQGGAPARAARPAGEDSRARVVGSQELLQFFEEAAQEAVDEAGSAPVRKDSEQGPRRLMVGLTGYPNVGKSSTINALFGSKKTAVAATPGKTKHFQTLNVTERLTLCDCPGLVLAKYAASKAEMVAAGVIPIDRLTDVRAPIDVICARISRAQLEQVYAVKLPRPTEFEDPHRPPSAAELLRSYALSRGYAAAGGLPDETKAGRQILKDYCDGKLLYAERPPGHAVPAAPAGGQQSTTTGPASAAAGDSGAAVVHRSTAAVAATAKRSTLSAAARTFVPAASMQHSPAAVHERLIQDDSAEPSHDHPVEGPAPQPASATPNPKHTTYSGDSPKHTTSSGDSEAPPSSSSSPRTASEDQDGPSADAHSDTDAANGVLASPSGTGSSRRSAADSGVTGPLVRGSEVQAVNEVRAVDAEPWSEADRELMAGMAAEEAAAPPGAKPKRAAHKFNKKPARTKGLRGLAVEDAGVRYDGAAFAHGKRGGLVRVAADV